MEARLTLPSFVILFIFKWCHSYYYPPENGLLFCSQSEITLPATLYMTYTKNLRNQYGYYHGHYYYQNRLDGYHNVPTSQRPEGQCQTVLSASKPLRVKLEYLAFNLEACSEGYYPEYVEIRSKQKICGTRTGESHIYEVSQDHPLVIIYKWTSFSTGFIIAITEVEQMEVCSKYAENLLLPVSLASPGYPNMDRSNRDCEITLSMPDHSPRIQIKFVKLDLDENPSCSQNALLIGGSRYCQNLTGEVLFEDVKSSSVSVRFISDGTASASGFLVEISSVPNFCNKRWSGDDLPAKISSPGYPSLYPNNLDCKIDINTLGWPRMALKLISFELEADKNNNCKFDYLEVGHSRFCGNHSAEEIEINTLDINSVILKFFADDSVQRTGFEMELSFVKAHDVCERTNITLPANIRSPNFPQHYPNQQSCEAEIWSSSDFLIEFVDFNLENGSDFLYVGEKSFTGLLTKSSEIIRSDNSQPLKFTSDKTINMKGFWIKLTPLDPPLTQTVSTSTIDQKLSTQETLIHTERLPYMSATTISTAVLSNSPREESDSKTTPAKITNIFEKLSSISKISDSPTSNLTSILPQISSSKDFRKDPEYQSVRTVHRLESPTFSSTEAEEVSGRVDESEEATDTYSYSITDDLNFPLKKTKGYPQRSTLPQSNGCLNCNSSTNYSIIPMEAGERVSAPHGISFKQVETEAVDIEEMIDRKLTGMSSTNVSFYFIGFFSACLISAVIIFILVRRLRAKKRKAIDPVRKDADENAYVIS